jgi:protein ImuB
MINRNLAEKLLKALASYCIRYCPIVAIDPPDGLILDVTGCSHLWGGDLLYITTIINRFKGFGYDVKAAIADTIGAAWAITHFDEKEIVIQSKQQYFALLFLSPAALRLEPDTIELLYKLGLGTDTAFYWNATACAKATLWRSPYRTT